MPLKEYKGEVRFIGGDGINYFKTLNPIQEDDEEAAYSHLQKQAEQFMKKEGIAEAMFITHRGNDDPITSRIVL